MAFFEQARKLSRFMPGTVNRDTFGVQTRPQCVVLGARDDLLPSTKPPVRLFVGTEPAQYRAERVFVWSIEQVRDPARTYEIHLMKELRGFDRRGWLTGFTNYRFAVPHFAAETGRAIYNDVDQIYLADPGELFDTELDGRGYLALSKRDTAVMLMDCACMARVWTFEEAQRQPRKIMEVKAGAVSGLWGALDPVWHARDAEYVRARSKLVHYTAIHMQPWQPFPRRYAYQRHPVAQVWLELEHRANVAGYQVFTSARPSARYHAAMTRLRMTCGGDRQQERLAPAGHRGEPDGLRDLYTAIGARTLLAYGYGMADEISRWQVGTDLGEAGPTITPYEVASASSPEPPRGTFDGVVCGNILESIPDEDVSWVLEEVFGYADRFVYMTITNASKSQKLPDGIGRKPHRHDPSWWQWHIATVSARHPDVHWKLVIQTRNAWGRNVVYRREGGSCLPGFPSVWVLTDDHPGNTIQSVGLVEALGWSYEVKNLYFTRRVAHFPLRLDQARSAALEPPWPDVVVTTGWRTAPVARWIGKQSQGRTRLVQMGRRGGQVAAWFDAVVSCTHFRFPPHPRRIETVIPLTHVSPERLAQAAERWRELFADTPQPRIALLVGGNSGWYRLDADTAQRLGEEVRGFAEAAGGSVFATTSLRTGREATEALWRGLGEGSYQHAWQPDQLDNPYLGYLALADVFVVTGDSESMLAEAAATGKPFYIYPLPERPPRLRTRLREWVVTQAQKTHLNSRHTARPQQGIAYLCARLIERGRILPPNDVNTLHQALVGRGIGRFFGEPLDTEPRPGLREIDAVARQVRMLVGISDKRTVLSRVPNHRPRAGTREKSLMPR